MFEKEKIYLDLSRLAYYSNWQTPKHYKETSRFNTHFFISKVSIEESQNLSEDGKETLQIDWLQPKIALDLYKNDKINLLPPQFCTLLELCNLSYDQFDFMHYFVEPIMPDPISGQVGLIMTIPGDHLHYTATTTEINDKRINRIGSDDNGKIMLHQNGWRRIQPTPKL
jgi:hypothetical protein